MLETDKYPPSGWVENRDPTATSWTFPRCLFLFLFWGQICMFARKNVCMKKTRCYDVLPFVLKSLIYTHIFSRCKYNVFKSIYKIKNLFLLHIHCKGVKPTKSINPPFLCSLAPLLGAFSVLLIVIPAAWLLCSVRTRSHPPCVGPQPRTVK